MSTMTAMTDPAADVEADDALAVLIDTGSCCAEVGLGSFLPGLVNDYGDYALD